MNRTVKDFLAEKGIEQVCPICEKDKFSEKTTITSAPNVLVCCVNCGLVLSFDLSQQ